ncbi:hypothetical protein GVN20_16795 [Runella sp. CRIBMP]|uniref:Antitoxin n=1 Tax=Runella salmonicolor TaxID=2950278 RepID=A0ABT1FHF3_9BACT|nr:MULTISPECIES: hypothetical protein [Runella]MCP1380930.1 hypothetical protein [Runella salmonicolor]NBB21027.1 hypothetical protein [Runella sp. CRIBMP]
MTTTIELNAEELDYQLFRSLKAMYKNRKIRLTIDSEMDETDYLLSSLANREALEKSMEEAKRGEKIVVTLSDLRK